MSEFSSKFSHDAHLKNVIAPEAPVSSGGTPPPEVRKHGKIPLRYKLIGGGVVAILAGGAALGINAMNSGQATNKAPAVPTVPVDPSEKPSPSHTIEVKQDSSIEQLIATHEIKANQSPEALARNIATESSNWLMAGSDTVVHEFADEVRKTADSSDPAISKFLDGFVAKEAIIYGSALCGKNYASNPTNAKVVSNNTSLNKEVLWNVIITQNDQNPYARSINFTSLASSSQSNITFDYKEIDNAEQGNRVNNGVNGSTGRLSYNYDVLNGVVVINNETVPQ